MFAQHKIDIQMDFKWTLERRFDDNLFFHQYVDDKLHQQIYKKNNKIVVQSQIKKCKKLIFQICHYLNINNILRQYSSSDQSLNKL